MVNFIFTPLIFGSGSAIDQNHNWWVPFFVVCGHNIIYICSAAVVFSVVRRRSINLYVRICRAE